MLTLFICIAIAGQSQKLPLNDIYFEGILRFKYTVIDANGRDLFFSTEEDEDYYDKNHLVHKTLKGRILDNIGNVEIHLDSEKKQLYRIDHEKRTINTLTKSDIELINPLEFKKVGETKLLGYQCDIFFIKYVHKMEYMKSFINIKPDTLSCTYYIAKDLKILNPEIFADLQGNHSTKLIDGRFSGIALKIIQEYLNGDKMIIEAISVEKRDMQDLISLPPYPFLK